MYHFYAIACFWYNQINMSKQKDYPSSKEILYLLGIGTLLVGSIIMPGLGIAGGAIIRAKRKYDFQEDQKAWKKFNLRLLKRNLKRLHEQKVVEITQENGQEVIKLTQKGYAKFLRFKLEDHSLKEKAWDGKWRLVLYDIATLKKDKQEGFRRILKSMNFLALQKSAYLTPYKCNQQINYLREYFSLGEEVLLLEISQLENDKYFKEYFGI